MPGSSDSVACPNMMLNTIVADVLEKYADRLENAKDFTKELNTIIHDAYHNHKRIVFNGDGYTEAWVKEAEKRGLLNLASTADAMPYYTHPENVKLFEHHGVLSKDEVYSRSEIQLENYTKQLHIEALTMIDMIYKDILPAAGKYMKDLSEEAQTKTAVCANISTHYEKDILQKLSSLCDSLYQETEKLQKAIAGEGKGSVQEQANYSRHTLFAQMEKTRKVADEIEPMVGKTYWPYPTYGDMLFSVV